MVIAEKLTNELTDDQKKYVIDLMVTMVVEELSEELQVEPKEVLHRFIASNTGELLYDEESKLWWSGPSDIAEMYKKEMGVRNSYE